MRGPWASPADPHFIGEMPDEYENRETRWPRSDAGTAEPIPPGHGEPAPPPSLEDGVLVPVCPHCGGLVRRELTDPDRQRGWRCDIDGPVVPRWEED
jgi:hypothetical protein